jgi:hypothetical protein
VAVVVVALLLLALPVQADRASVVQERPRARVTPLQQTQDQGAVEQDLEHHQAVEQADQELFM